MDWEEFEAKLGAVMSRLGENAGVAAQLSEGTTPPMVALGLCQHIFIHYHEIEDKYPGEIEWFREQMTHLATKGTWDTDNDPDTAIYTSDFGDHRECKCGHPYYRHFDPFENDAPVGCKYCQCERWEDG